jgi:hypothetical protein
MSGFIAWQGPSPMTGDPTVLVLTGRSMNEKTGPMYQAWLLLRDVSPFEGLKSGTDRAICGDCVHRSGKRRTCYVSMFNGPIKIWRGMQDGRYPIVDPSEGGRRLAGEHVRATAYGDPAFVPFDVWAAILSRAAGWAGYTHQWRSCDTRFRSLLMASVDSPSEAIEARGRGWRTFRARPSWMPLEHGEFQCPASEEGGHRSTCIRCQLCRGTSSPAKSVSIFLHGKGAAPRIGPRARYNGLRSELAEKGHSDMRLSVGERQRVVLALRHYYLRHKQDVTLRTKSIGDGLYRFWIDTMAGSL